MASEMKKNLPFSEEVLNAFVDGELDTEEHKRVVKAQLESTEVAQAICQLRLLKDLVNVARPQNTQETFSSKSPPISIDLKTVRRFQTRFQARFPARPFAFSSVAVALLLAAAVSLYLPERHGEPAGPVLRYPDMTSLLAASEQVDALDIVIHLKHAQRGALKRLMRQLETALIDARDDNRFLRIEVVASGPGLGALREDVSPVASEIHALRSQFPNIKFVACGKTRQRIAKNENKTVPILPDAVLVASGPKQISLRRSQGWVFVEV